jgi:hypothetical protein
MYYWERAREADRLRALDPPPRLPPRDADADAEELERRVALRERAVNELLRRSRGEQPAEEYGDVTLSGWAQLLAHPNTGALDQPQNAIALAHSMSDFPALTANIGKVLIGSQLDSVSTTGDKIARRVQVRDFKPAKTVTTSGFPTLVAADEAAEIVYGSMADSAEPLVLSSYARLFGISRQVFLADDLQTLQATFLAAAERVAQHRNGLLWALIRSGASANGPTTADGIQYFHSGHANLCAGAALDATSLGLAVAKLRKQKSLDGTDLGIPPRFLTVGPDLEVAAAKLLREVGDQVPLELLVESGISDASFYIFADPAVRPAFVIGQLGTNPTLLARQGFSRDGLEYRLIVDVGVGAGDWRAAVKTPPA